MDLKKYSLKVYSIRTPKYSKGHDIEINNLKLKKTHFEINVLDNFFEALKCLPDSSHRLKVNLPNISDECEITFIRYSKISPFYSLIEFETDRYGLERPIKDMKLGTSEKKLLEHESVPSKLFLILHRKYGLVYVTKDTNSIINKKTLNNFFNHYRKVLIQYIEEWNILNKESGYKIYRQPPIKVDGLPSMEFLEEISNLLKITEFSYSYDPSGSNDVPDFHELDAMSEAGLRRKDFKEVRTYKQIMQINPEKRVDKIKKLYENIYDKSNYDDFYIKGLNYYGSERVLKPNFSTRSENIRLMDTSDLKIDEIVKEIERLLNEEDKNPLKDTVQKLEGIDEVSIDYSDDEVKRGILESFKM